MRRVQSSMDISRRSALLAGTAGLFGAIAARWLDAGEALAGEPAARPGGATAQAMIVLWMNGGPSHVDTFDPKPGAATGGPFKAIPTRAPGLRLSEHLPRLAEEADKIALVRGMTSKEGSHERARHLVHTGYSPNPTVIHPSLGAWVSEELKATSDLPSFVSIGGPSAGPGFLGAQHAPFAVQAGAPPENVERLGAVDDARFEARTRALAALEQRFAAETGNPLVQGRQDVYGRASALMRSPRLAQFDLSTEPEATRKAYGDTDFGRGCLLARRLVESGVRYIEVTLDGWDTHLDNFERVKTLSATLDPALAALLRDLESRHLLDKTLVACMGEFGRSPVINKDDGRDHHPDAWSLLLAGGGVRRGVVVGETDARGEKVAKRPVTVPDLFTTFATLLGMDPTKTLLAPSGRPIGLTDGGTLVQELAG